MGNANVTFNHLGGVPEQVGNALRIETNTDATSNPTFVLKVRQQHQQMCHYHWTQ